MKAGERGDMVAAVELGFAAREAWENHCAAHHAKMEALKRQPIFSVWTRDHERDR